MLQLLHLLNNTCHCVQILNLIPCDNICHLFQLHHPTKRPLRHLHNIHSHPINNSNHPFRNMYSHQLNDNRRLFRKYLRYLFYTMCHLLQQYFHPHYNTSPHLLQHNYQHGNIYPCTAFPLLKYSSYHLR
mgnify:CR=1 FL=1